MIASSCQSLQSTLVFASAVAVASAVVACATDPAVTEAVASEPSTGASAATESPMSQASASDGAAPQTATSEPESSAEDADADAAADADTLLGAWQVPGKNLVVDVRKSGDVLEGIVTKAPVSRLVGKKLFRNLVFDPGAGTYAGEVLAVRKKQYVPGVFKVDGDKMTIRAGKGSSSDSVDWVRK